MTGVTRHGVMSLAVETLNNLIAAHDSRRRVCCRRVVAVHRPSIEVHSELPAAARQIGRRRSRLSSAPLSRSAQTPGVVAAPVALDHRRCTSTEPACGAVTRRSSNVDLLGRGAGAVGGANELREQPCRLAEASARSMHEADVAMEGVVSEVDRAYRGLDTMHQPVE